eukprot:CAMPEP_0179232390 /NCGR_PEP_ID=MMETSP0797-20121207/11834_1 /TAXON_ID=47934 /ORGANISM="Dinophysis acuminata, Strain DAEP01" /LENGTH=234 /DNA_ID=CAMNT_0020939507 /DNA_START=302 /DNA_END=1004 /DNA_ORIENTATION=-
MASGPTRPTCNISRKQGVCTVSARMQPGYEKELITSSESAGPLAGPRGCVEKHLISPQAAHASAASGWWAGPRPLVGNLGADIISRRSGRAVARLCSQRALDHVDVAREVVRGAVQVAQHGLADEDVQRLHPAELFFDTLLDHGLVGWVRSSRVLRVEVGQAGRQGDRDVEAPVVLRADDALLGAEDQPLELAPALVQELVGLQDLEEAPGPGEREGLGVEDHAGAPAAAAPQG